MDRSQSTGLILISALVMGYLFYVSQQTPPPHPSAATPSTEQQQHTTTEADRTNTMAQTPAPVPEAEQQVGMATPNTVIGKHYEVETEDLVLSFNSKGGHIEAVTLKQHQTWDHQALVLFDSSTRQVRAQLQDLALDQLSFSTTLQAHQKISGGDSLRITFSHPQVQQTYVVTGQGHVVHYTLSTPGNSQAILHYQWRNDLLNLEDDQRFSMTHSGLYYQTAAGDFDNFGDGSGDDAVNPEEDLAWISNKQRFFNFSMIAGETAFQKARLQSSTRGLLPNAFKKLSGSFELPLEGGQTAFRYFFGPNKYEVLDKVTDGFEDNVYLGWGIFGWINEFCVLPIFRILERLISNYGLIILLLVIIIKVLLFPIAYKSYLSMATMKELKPEIDEIKKRVGAEKMQEVQQETMKLYQQVGVNPLSGCIPMLLQMPILFALFNFFPNAVELRQEAFLWAHDLSTYDDIISWNTDIPLITTFMGNHISLFTLLMTLSTLAYTYYNNQINASAQGPMKTVGYIMPAVFFFVLNSYAAGLTFYYFVSNIITIGQQLIASRFIDKEKIRSKLDENKKNALAGKRKQSKFQARLQEALKAQQAAGKK